MTEQQRVRVVGVSKKAPSLLENEIVQYILTTIIIPAVKTIILDTIETSLYGGRQQRRPGLGGGTASRISYRSSHNDLRGEPSRPNYLSPTRSAYPKIDDLVFASHGEAELVLSELLERAESFGNATVADLYNVAGLSGDYTLNSYGWTYDDLRNAPITSIREGVVLNLPNPHPIRPR